MSRRVVIVALCLLALGCAPRTARLTRPRVSSLASAFAVDYWIAPATGTPSQTYTTTYAPIGEVQVLRNGLDLTVGVDYTIAPDANSSAGGMMITFLAPIQPGDIVKARYFQ